MTAFGLLVTVNWINSVVTSLNVNIEGGGKVIDVFPQFYVFKDILRCKCECFYWTVNLFVDVVI